LPLLKFQPSYFTQIKKKDYISLFEELNLEEAVDLLQVRLRDYERWIATDVIDDMNIKYNVIYINCRFEIALSSESLEGCSIPCWLYRKPFGL